MTFSSLPSVAGHIRGDKLRALAVTGAKRRPPSRTCRPWARQGLAGFELSPWFGLLAPAGTPEAVVKKINADVAERCTTRTCWRSSRRRRRSPYATRPDQFARILLDDIQKWSQVVKTSGAKID
jgi:tripartite-type tricarboxylate transporter receptor subunit TctC